MIIVRDFTLYQYNPSKAAAVLFAVLFIICTALACLQLVRALKAKRTHPGAKYGPTSLIPFILGGICEIIGYIARAASHKDPTALNPYIIQSVLILIAPTLFAATIYMTLGRIIRCLECEKYSLVSVKWMTKIFVIGDIISFLMQGSGGGLMAQGQDSMKTGKNIIIGGLIVQLIFFCLFIIVEVLFQVRISSKETNLSIQTRNSPSKFRNWQTILHMLLACSCLILVRSIMRLIEYAEGNDGYIMSHEWFLYVFDAVMMFVNMVLFISQDVGYFYVQFPRLKNFENFELYDLENGIMKPLHSNVSS